jgi:uncharacterized protein (TIGR03435 family)
MLRWKKMRVFLAGFLGAIALGQSNPDPKPDFPPSREVHISPSTLKQDSQSVTSRPDYWTARGFTLKDIVARLYKVEERRVILPAALDAAPRYDFALVLPAPEEDAAIDRLVEQAIQTRFGIAIAREKRLSDVYVMTASHELPAATSRSGSSGVTITATSISANNATMQDISEMLEHHLQRTVLDETGLTGRYEFALTGITRSTGGFLKALNEKLGLTLTPAPREVDMIIVTLARAV